MTATYDNMEDNVERVVRVRDVPMLPWTTAMREMDWKQGEHVTVIGPTGIGKTEVTTALADYRKWIVYLNTKNKDKTRDLLINRDNYKIIRDAAGLQPEIARHYVVWPSIPKRASVDTIKDINREVFREALMRIYRQGGWTILINELRYISQRLKLDDELLLLWLQGRSEDISVVAEAQRPRWVPLEAFDQPEHLFFFRDSDGNNVSRIAELVSVHRAAVEQIVPRLDGHDVLYVNTRDGNMFITNTRK